MVARLPVRLSAGHRLRKTAPAAYVRVHLIQGLSNPDYEARRLLGKAEKWIKDAD
jgi:hypothetical protein